MPVNPLNDFMRCLKEAMARSGQQSLDRGGGLCTPEAFPVLFSTVIHPAEHLGGWGELFSYGLTAPDAFWGLMGE